MPVLQNTTYCRLSSKWTSITAMLMRVQQHLHLYKSMCNMWHVLDLYPLLGDAPTSGPTCTAYWGCDATIYCGCDATTYCGWEPLPLPTCMFMPCRLRDAAAGEAACQVHNQQSETIDSRLCDGVCCCNHRKCNVIAVCCPTWGAGLQQQSIYLR